MQVQVRFFALYRERVGASQKAFAVAEGATVGELVAEVVREHPNLCPNPAIVVVAVNREYAGHEQRLKAGDEAAFIPPVSGGQ